MKRSDSVTAPLDTRLLAAEADYPLAQIVELQTKLAEIEEALELFRALLKSQGSYSTANYTCTVEHVRREQAPSLSTLHEHLPPKQFQLYIEPFIKQISYQTVKVTKRGA